MSLEVIYRVERPFADGVIEVYTQEPGGASYEWRILARGELVIGEGEHHYEVSTVEDSRDQQYGSAAVALRDALIRDTE